ncbi:MAG: helix-turn-helix domain-containing protein [Anaerolineae bacterium]
MAENLWFLREQKRISVATLASRAGLPIGLVMEYESGQRSIDRRHLARLARALYVEESDIKLQSDPRPGAAPLERQAPREAGRPAPAATSPAASSQAAVPIAQPPARKLRERPPRPKAVGRPLSPPRPSQLAHLENLLKRLNKTAAEVEAELGKPLASLDRRALSAVLRDLQSKLKEVPQPVRHRAYLPEAVDEFEARYLTTAQEAGDTLHFTLFDGSTVTGQVIGFSPYSITVRVADGAEVTLNKLALVSYTRPAAAQPQEPTP